MSVNARCTKCGGTLKRVSVKAALKWLSCDEDGIALADDPRNPHQCWVPRAGILSCYWCGKEFADGDFERLGKHVSEECSGGSSVQ